tara:strand:+ start:117 stop:545 length:429 start_codon:yes stop_codon:yes gene_type:complete
MKKFIFLLIISICSSATTFANEFISESTEGAKLYFILPVDGQIVSGEFKVQFGLSGMGVAPAGIKVKDTGHHHLLINTDVSTIDFTGSLPATDQIRHFGGGQTETVLKLPKGKHTLQLLLGNYVHIPHKKPVISDQITITVE